MRREPWLLKGSTQREEKPAPSHAEAVGEERWWICRQCSAPVTPVSARVEMDGAHVHMRENPLGRVFLFGCFANAPGASTVGEPSSEATWFLGYRWAIAVCRGCRAHLGWRYEGREPGFFGLILEHLVEQELPRA